MKEFMSLRVLDKGQRLFRWIGIDYGLMRRILQVKLTMDSRRVPTLVNNGTVKKSEDNDSNQFWKSMWVYALMGLILIPFIIMGENYFFQMSMLFAIFMFFIMSSLIADFSHVMLDIRDQTILLTKPVDGRTLSMAKLIHIIIYLGSLTLIFIAPALIAAIFTQGIGFCLLFILVVVLIDLWIVLVTALIYFAILKYLDGEKLKDFISYVQIALSILMVVGYQMIGRMFSILDNQIEFVPSWWNYLIAPVWYAAPFEVMLNGSYSWSYLALSSLAIIVPILSVIIYLHNIENFEKYLQKLNNHAGSIGKKKRRSFPMLLFANKEERLFFHFAMDLMKSEQSFKLKVYPSIGLLIIFPFIMLLTLFGDGGWKGIENGSGYYTIYFCGIIIPTIATGMRYSNSFKGAWIYKTAPLINTEPIFKGAWKAVMVKYVLPIYLAFSLIFLSIYGASILVDLFLVLCMLWILPVLSFRIFKLTLPFSKPASGPMDQEAMKALFVLLIVGVFAGTHALVSQLEYGLYGYGIILLIVAILLWRFGFKVGFTDLEE